MQSELMQPGEAVLWRRELPVSPTNERGWHLLNVALFALLASMQLLETGRLSSALEGAPRETFLLLILPTVALSVHLIPWIRDRWLVRSALIASLIHVLFLFGAFVPPFQPSLAAFSGISLILGGVLSAPARGGNTKAAGALHLTDRGAHWLMPGKRSRFAPWQEITTRYILGRLSLTGYPGAKKTFTVELSLSPEDHDRLQQAISRKI